MTGTILLIHDERAKRNPHRRSGFDRTAITCREPPRDARHCANVTLVWRDATGRVHGIQYDCAVLRSRARLLRAAKGRTDMSLSSPRPDGRVRLETLNVALERDVFLRTLIRHLSGTLQDVVGIDEAAGFISVVGQRMGEEISDGYKATLDVPKLDRELVRDVCLDLKRRIQGDFYVISEDDEKIVFGNRVCPFAEKVIGREALCMMTSNVFGTIAVENLGYGKIVLEETIARGDPGCRVVLFLKRTKAAEKADGREYIRGT